MSAASEAIAPLDTTAEIETPEHVRFRYHLAGPARRFFAWLLDLLIRGLVIVLFVIAFLVAGFSLGEEVGAASVGVLAVIYFLVEWFYYVAFEVLWSGRTPGKRALELRVIGHEGHPMRFGQSILRNFLRAADFLPSFYALGVLVMGHDNRFRRFGDLVAGTMVVVEKRHMVEGPVRINPPPTTHELASLPQRLPLDGDDLEAIELLLRREVRFSPARTYELASMVAPIYAARLNLRVADPVRFLKILYARARGIAGVEAAPVPWAQAAPPGHRAAPGYGPAPGYAPPPGYGPPQGYGPAPGYGPPQGYGPPGYGPLQGYGPPPGYGPAPGYGPPPGNGPPGYGPLVGPPGYGPAQGPQYGSPPAFDPSGPGRQNRRRPQ